MAMVGEEKAGGSRSKVLVIGATGRFGQELVKASLAAGHPTYALVREPTFSRADASLLLRSFSASGVTLLKVVLALFVRFDWMSTWFLFSFLGILSSSKRCPKEH